MIKKQKKWIALFEALAFIWLLQLSAMPVTAASAEQGPNFVETAGHKNAPVAKKSILPYVLIGAGAVAVAVVLILVVFKTNYDITGGWDFVFHNGSDTENFTIVFTGTKASGNFQSMDVQAHFGPYTVDGKNVTMTFTLYPEIQCSGQFTGKNTMAGTLVDEGDTWNWTAERSMASPLAKPIPTAQAKLFPR
ncbi:MAG: hypothetical protein NTW95_00240 [Candidatus Aminicenantes bacterium]|nr:hypothetical protein [Candidatus Aminicenantes bacterium]